MSQKRVYLFGNGKAEGNAKMREELGGKGANLAEMNLIGVPVPPGSLSPPTAATSTIRWASRRLWSCSTTT